MKGYIDEFGDDIVKDAGTLKVVWNGDSIWITNFIKIIKYGNEDIVLKIKDNNLIIMGESIKIMLMDKNEIVLKGKFDSISLEKKYKKEP